MSFRLFDYTGALNSLRLKNTHHIFNWQAKEQFMLFFSVLCDLPDNP